MTLLFTPPSRNSVPPILPRNGPDQSALGRRLFRHYRSRPQGINVFLLSNGTVTEEYPDGETFFYNEADGSPYVAYAFLGGHDDYEVTAEQAALLSAEGYTIVDDSEPTPTPPTISSLSPASGVIGTTITVIGTNLAEVTDVTMNGDAVAFTIVGSTQITFVAPSLADGDYTVAVTNIHGSDTETWTYSTPVIPQVPVLTSLNPSSGARGSTFIINGTSLSTVTQVVMFVDSVAFTINSSTQITATALPLAEISVGPAEVTVVSPTGTSNTLIFTFTASAHPDDDVLLESGDFLLLEDGTSTLLLEE